MYKVKSDDGNEGIFLSIYISMFQDTSFSFFHSSDDVDYKYIRLRVEFGNEGICVCMYIEHIKCNVNDSW